MKKFIYGALALLPTVSFGASSPDVTGVTGLITGIGQIISKIIPVMFALAIVYFFWGLAQFILKAGDPKESAAGRTMMIYGIIALAVMVSVYGLIAWLQTTLGVQPGNAGVQIPCIPGYPCN